MAVRTWPSLQPKWSRMACNVPSQSEPPRGTTASPHTVMMKEAMWGGFPERRRVAGNGVIASM